MIGILLLFLPEKKGTQQKKLKRCFLQTLTPEQSIIIIIFFSLLI